MSVDIGVYKRRKGRVVLERSDMKMKVLSTVTVEKTDDFYKVVDQLNRTLKDKGLTFGYALDEKDHSKITMTIYEV